MSDNILRTKFYEKIKEESQYKKVVSKEVIKQLLGIFNANYKKIEYSSKINNPLEIALNFYKELYPNYYKMIIDGLNNKKIAISDDNKSYTNKYGMCYIKLSHNDSDVFLIVHEFGHYIDRNSNPKLIPDEYHILSEVIPFYMEKQLEIYLGNEYDDLIKTRINNRLFFENRFITIIKAQLSYEEAFINDTLLLTDADDKMIKRINSLGLFNIVNYLLRYPLANILSDYLINNPDIKLDYDIVNNLLQLDLLKLINTFQRESNDKNTHNIKPLL